MSETNQNAWVEKYCELVGHKEVLYAKLNDGLFVPDEWQSVMKEMRDHGMFAMANDIDKRYIHYMSKWKAAQVTQDCTAWQSK